MLPGFSLRSNPGLQLANAFGVIRFNQTDPLPDVSFALDSEKEEPQMRDWQNCHG